MGEGLEDRVGMIATLAGLPVHPESVPIHMLVQVEGTPLAVSDQIAPLDLARPPAVARSCMRGWAGRVGRGPRAAGPGERGGRAGEG